MKDKIKRIIYNREIKAWAYCLIIAVIFLTFCSRSSFLFPYNNWDDANSYFSMGKFMMNGGIIYRDLYDQKGPWLYLMYGIAYLISNKSFFGVYLWEILAITIYLFFGYKIIRLYTSYKISLFLLPIPALAGLISLSFYWGGAAEEFCLPVLMAGLYISLKYFRKEYPKPPGWKLVLAGGILAGLILGIKYTMLGFFFAWMAMMTIMNLKAWRTAIRNCFVFLGGMLLPMLPWLIYFGVHEALDDWYICYVYNNIFLYSELGSDSIGILGKIYQLAKILYNLIWDNYSYFSFILIGFYYLLFSRSSRLYEKINIYMMFGFLFLGIYIGGADIFYYSIPLMIFSILGVAAIGRVFVKIENRFEIYFARAKKVYFTFGIILLVSCAGYAALNTRNADYRSLKKEDHFLYQFTKEIEKEENPSLLNVNMLDAGLYTATGIVPTVKYFQTNGIPLKEMFTEQQQYIKEGKTMFVISRFEEPEFIHDKYELVKKAVFKTDGVNDTPYYLFKRK